MFWGPLLGGMAAGVIIAIVILIGVAIHQSIT